MPAPAIVSAFAPAPTLSLAEVDGRWRADERLDLAIAVAREFALHHASGEAVGPVAPEGVWVRGGAVLFETLARAETVPFAAPEVRGGAEVTLASDVYTLGALTFSLMSGRRPPSSFDAEALRRAEAHGWRWVRPIRFAVCPQPEDRYPSAAAFVAELEALRHARASARPPSRGSSASEAPERSLHPVAQALLGGVTVAVCAGTGAVGAFALMGALVVMAGFGARRAHRRAVARWQG